MFNLAELAELVDAHVSGTCAARLGSSSLPFRIALGLEGKEFPLFYGKTFLRNLTGNYSPPSYVKLFIASKVNDGG